MANVTLGEYIRRRRMTRAAFDLRDTADKIVDIALRYGYDSPTAFNRAFQSIHGVAPSAARQDGVRLKAYHPISFKITIRGYYIAVPSSQPAPEGMLAYDVPACTWAIFECKGAMPHSVQNMQKRIVTEWFPNSGYQYADAPDIEQYTEGDQSSEAYTCYIWVPVKK